MGWTSTGDPYANVGDAGLSFDSEQAAKEFAEKHGWDYTVCALLKFYSFCGYRFHLKFVSWEFSFQFSCEMM